jgi:hypothetical protein
MAMLLIIIFSGIAIKSYLNKTAHTLDANIDKINIFVIKGDWNSAHEYTNILNKDWAASQDIWALFINHHEIDSISSSLTKAIQYINYNDDENSAAYLAELKEYISHIPDMEKLSLRNIF